MWWVGCHFPGLPNSGLQGRMVVDPCYFHWGLQHTGNLWPQLHCQVPIPSCTAVPDDIVKYGLVQKQSFWSTPYTLSLWRKHIRCWSPQQRLSTWTFNEDWYQCRPLYEQTWGIGVLLITTGLSRFCFCPTTGKPASSLHDRPVGSSYFIIKF